MNRTNPNISFPLFIYQLEALLKRLPLTHPKRSTIEADLAMTYAGYRGELATNYYLNMLPKDTYSIIHGLRLQTNHKGYFQMDFLILTKMYYIIMEVKNLKGLLQFDPDFDQMIRKFKDEQDCFGCPINQVSIQTTHLSHWFLKNKLPQLPIYPLVVISSPSSIIEAKSNAELVKQQVLHSHGIEKKLNSIEKNHNPSHFSPLKAHQITQIQTSLLSGHCPRKDHVLEKYSLTSNELIKGIHCPNCDHFTVLKYKKRWYCQNCRMFNSNSYKEAINDFKLIFGGHAKNSSLRNFLNIESRHVVRRILIEESKGYDGVGKGREYVLKDSKDYI